MIKILNNPNDIELALQAGCIIFKKNGIIHYIESPDFGNAVLTFKDGRVAKADVTYTALLK